VTDCQEGGSPGFKCGDAGKCYTYTSGDESSRKRAKQKAIDQCIAIGEEPSADGEASLAAVTSAGMSKSRLQAVRAALVAAGVEEPAGRGLVTGYDLTTGSPAVNYFHRRALELDLSEVHSEGWPTDETELAAGHAFVSRTPWGEEGVYESDGVLALVRIGGGTGDVKLTLAAKAKESVVDAVGQFRSRYPFAQMPEDDLVPVTFWSYGMFGPSSYVRRVDVQPWSAIEANYTAAGGVRDELARLMSSDFEPGRGGQLLLWQGPPGTGKTWALRALASEWRSWADFHYVLVLEDTGELLSSDAKEKSGQGLSRLLNVVDGLIGQGLRVLCLVTTNDQIEDFHPAVSRPGRCASAIEFARLEADEVGALTGDPDPRPATLAEIFAARKPDDSEEPMPTLTRTDDPELQAALDAVSELATDDETEEAQTVRCPDCGAMVEPTDDGTCPECGAEIGEPVTAAIGDVPGIPAPVDIRPESNPSAEVDLPAQRTNASLTRWEGVLVVEDTITEDGRYIMPGATSWRDLPLSLAAMLETEEGHTGAEVCGRIDEIWREGNLVMGRGVFDETDFAREIADMVENRTLRGNSVDLAIREYELAPRSDFDESGHRVRETDVDPFELLFAEGDDAKLVVVFRDCVIGMSTVCPFPAFADAQIAVVAGASPLEWRYTRQQTFSVTRRASVAAGNEPAPEVEVEPPAPVESPDLEGLTASAAGLVPEKPPASWFADPQFTELTPLTVTDDGRVYGHFAEWGTCHIGIPDVCVEPPNSMTQYAYFHLGEVETAEGERVSVGHITLDAPHAGKSLGRQAATAHYDHTGTVVADVVAGEDVFGPWIAGTLRPDLDAKRVRELTAATLSGDWRNVNGHLELVALLAVNVPGFPVPRTRALVAAGADDRPHVVSLVAAGVVDPLSPTERRRLADLATVADGGLSALAARVA
jgi:hypothetical protein